MRHIGLFAGIATLALSAAAQAAPLVFGDRAAFESNLVAQDTDGFDRADYGFGASFSILSDSQMSSARGETDFTSTGFSNTNLVGPINGSAGSYCAGCNGSFQLGFTTTSIGNTDGITAFGIDILDNVSSFAYDAFVSFADGSMETFDLGSGPSFFGITSTKRIAAIDFTQANGNPAQSGQFSIDNLTIGEVAPIPLPAGLPLALLGLGALAGVRLRAA